MPRREDNEATLERSQLNDAERVSERRLVLLLFGDGFAESHPLPPRGQVRIGRAETNTISIDHALISREHAEVEVGDEIRVQDLGSRNGTFVRGERLEPGVPKVVAPGQVFEVGGLSCLVQRAGVTAPPRRLATHDDFQTRVDEECRRAGAARRSLAVARVHVPDAVSPARVRRVLSGADLAASYAPGEYELLVRAPEAADKLVDKLRALPGAGAAMRARVVLYPRDGRTADQLLEAACHGVTARGPASTSSGPIVLDEGMRDLYRVAERVAQGSISVLLTGETGVGKEVFAEAIHRASPRRDKPFVRLNCAALTETLLESELFGHERGAFTGATATKVGLLESAQGGTVLLDEVGEMPLTTQAKLLRVLEQRQVLRVGGLQPIAIDVRFLAATNRDLSAEVVKGAFRQDVYFRLNGATLSLPPLRDRPLEIEALAERFIAETSGELALSVPPALSPAARDLLLGYAWPGNIRELKNVMARAVLLNTGEDIGREHLPFERMSLPWDSEVDDESDDGALSDDEAERQRILRALDACAGNQTRAAKMLGIGRRTLTTKLTKFGIRRPRK